MKYKVTSTIAGASAFITFFGLIGRLLGLARESLFANFFGLSSDYDLYLIAAVFPISINSIVIFLAQNYFIPTYHRIKNNSDSEARDFSNSSFWLFGVTGLLITVILLLFSEPIIHLYTQNDNYITHNQTVLIFRIFILTFPLNSLFAILAALSQAELQFRFPVLSQLILNSCIIIFVLFFNNQINILSIPLGYLIGTCIQVVYLYVRTKRYINPDFRKFLRLKNFALLNTSFVLLIIIEMIGQTYSIIDRYMWRFVDEGGIAALNYAFNLFNLPISIVAFSLATVLFPTLSKLSSKNSFDEITVQLKNYFSINLFLFVPITLVFIFYGNFIVKILFERGEFLNTATATTYNALIAYSFSFVFISSYVVLNKLFYSLNKIKALFFITIIGIFIKLILSFELVGLFKQTGLAMSSSFTYLFFFSVSYFLIFKWLQNKNFSVFFVELLFSGINGIITYFVIWLLRIKMIFDSQTVAILLNIFLFFTVYFINAYLVNHKSVAMIFDLINKIFGTRYKPRGFLSYEANDS